MFSISYLAYCFDTYLRTSCIIWKIAFDKSLFYGGDVMNISMFLFRYTCSDLYSLKYILHSLIIFSIRFYGMKCMLSGKVFPVKVVFSVLISLIRSCVVFIGLYLIGIKIETWSVSHKEFQMSEIWRLIHVLMRELVRIQRKLVLYCLSIK